MNKLFIKTWYYSPFPDDVVKQRLLYICENCLIYVPSEGSLNKHRAEKNCFDKQPGKQIYRKVP